MTSPIPSGFVFTKDRIAQAAAVVKDVKALAKRDRRRNIGWKLATGILTINLTASVFALAYSVPNIRILPIFLWNRPEGSIGVAITDINLPSALKDIDVKVGLWHYVRAHESYNFVEYKDFYAMVCAMSANPVRDAYVSWYNDPQNSFVATYGDKAAVRVELIDYFRFEPSIAGRPGRVTIYFKKQLEWFGEPPRPAETWAVTFEFVQGFKQGMDIRNILTDNPLRIVVTEYPGARREPNPGVRS